MRARTPPTLAGPVGRSTLVAGLPRYVHRASFDRWPRLPWWSAFGQPVTSPTATACDISAKEIPGWLGSNAGGCVSAPADKQSISQVPHAHHSHVLYLAGLTPLSDTCCAIVMLLTTLFTPLMSVASLVTSVFSAAFLAMPLTVTTPSVVPTLVLTELVE